MNKMIIAGLVLALTAITASAADTTAVASQTQTTSSVAGARSDNAGNVQNITFTNPDNTGAARAAGDASVTAAGVAGEAAVRAAHEMANGTQTVKNVPAIVGPALVSSNDTCMGSVSVGGAIAGAGIAIGSTFVDNNCKLLKNSRELWNMGMKAASLALMCKDEDNRDALEITGYVCPQTTKAQAKAAEQAKAAAETHPVAPSDTKVSWLQQSN